MDEPHWLVWEDPADMLKLLEGRASARKLRLFACACCRRIWQMLGDRSQQAVEMAEHFADGEANPEALTAILRRLGRESHHPATCVILEDAFEAATQTAWWSVGWSADLPKTMQDWQAARAADRAWHCDLLRDIFGNPFRPAFFNSSQQTPTVTGLAQAAYDNRLPPASTLDPVRLAILADALEEVGCEAEILGHLRGPGLHVRGCFVLDTLLDKS
jgi:hypothetical protein